MHAAPRYDDVAQIDRTGTRGVPVGAMALAATVTTGTWPGALRCAFILGTAGLLWTAIYGIALTLG